MTLVFRELPTMLPEMRMWYATKRGHSFAIVLEEKMGGEFTTWSGYSLSWKKLPGGPINKLEKPFYDSLEDAKKACEALADRVLK